MPTHADRAQAITDAVKQYLALLADGRVDDLVGLYADDATLEDPVGGEVHIGTTAITGFYTAFTEGELESELVSLRVAGNEAAFQIRLTMTTGDQKTRVEPIVVMAFDGRGKITAMKSYWAQADVTGL